MRTLILLAGSMLFFSRSFAAADGDRSATRLSELRGIWEAHFNQDASRVVTQTRGGVVAIWDLEKGTPVAADLGGESHLMSPDGKRVLIADKNGGKILDASNGRPIAPPLAIRFQSLSRPLANFSPDGETLVAFEPSTASVWRARDGEKIANLPWRAPTETDSDDSPPSAAFTSNGAFCFLHDGRGTVQRFETKTWQTAGAPIRHPAAESAYNFAIALSENGKWLATFDDPGENGPNGNLQLWDAITGKPLGRPLITTNGFVANFLPGMDRVVITPSRGEGAVRELPSMKSLYAIRQHDELDGPRVAISPNGKWILSWGPDAQLSLIETAEGKIVDTTSSRAQVQKVFFATDSSVAYVIYDNTAFLLEHHYDYYLLKMSLPEFKIMGSLRVLDFLGRMELSPDGRRLLLLQGVTDEERINIYDTATMKALD